uniref:Kinase-like protein n=1 Tax=Ascaris suum TaxID=6253 RepID=F1KV58_ASCSU
MASVLSSLFTRDPKAHFAYDLPQTSFHTSKGVSMGRSFKKAEPTEKATCFFASLDQYGGGANLKQQAQKLKTMRHPNVLTYLDSIEVENTFYLITECCVPLSVYISKSNFTGTQREFVVSWGLFQLMSCLKFLHREAKLSHENLRRSVYVTEAGDWKVSGLECATAFTNPRNDLNAMALLMWELFNGFNDDLTKPEAPGKLPQRLRDLYKKTAMPSAARLDTEELLNECRRSGGFFKNRFVDTLLFLEEFQLKDAHDKQAFFTQLKDHLGIFPDDVAKYKILPQLIHSYEYGDAGSHVLVPLFKLGRLLDEDEYQRRIVPCLCKLFSSPDRVTRVRLLERIDEFAAHLTPQVVNDKIYGNLASGFLDTNPAVRESTVKAMVSLADKLNNHNLNTDLMKYLARLQGSDDQPGIRTNTTICLGKIGCYIDPSQRQRILISAFTRALKDPFPPARMAAVLALSATQQYYSLVEVANRVVPALAPLTCDPEKQVRDQSFKALHGFIEKLEKASENPEMIPELEAQVQAGGKSGLLSSDKVPQWASWALKSLSGKFYKGTPPLQSGGGGMQQQKELPSSRESTPKPPEEPTFTQKAASEKSTISDGWGDLGDEIELAKEEVQNDREKSEVDANDEDDWSNDWETEKKVSVGTMNKPTASVPSMKAKSHHGVLKLNASSKKPLSDDDLDCLLGITPQPNHSVGSQSARTNTASSSFAVKTEKEDPGDGWNGTDTHSTGWDDFSYPTTAVESGGQSTAWDDPNWGKEAIKDNPHSKEARRAELAARNEARRKELAAKRAAKASAALRLGTHK